MLWDKYRKFCFDVNVLLGYKRIFGENVFVFQEASDYANLKDVNRAEKTEAKRIESMERRQEAVDRQREQQGSRKSPSPTLSRTAPSGSGVPPPPQSTQQPEPSPQMFRSSQNSTHQVPVADVSVEEMEEMMSQPIQSVTVKGIQGRPLEPRDTESPGGTVRRLNY